MTIIRTNVRTITVGTLKQAPEALDEPKDKPSQQGPRDTPHAAENYDQECFENNFASKGRVDNKNGCDQCAHGGCQTAAYAECERTDSTDSYSL